MFEFLSSLFGGGGAEATFVVDDNVCSSTSKKPKLSGFSYLFKKKRIEFDQQFRFTIHYLYNEEIWLAANSFASGIGFADPDEAVSTCVVDCYKRSLNQLVFNSDQEASVVCINKHGVLQLLDHIDFECKAEFTAWLIENVYCELEGKFVPSPLDEKLNKVLAAVDGIQRHNVDAAETNERFKAQVIERVAELNAKMSMYENVDDLYRRLREHHRTVRPADDQRRMSFMSSSSCHPQEAATGSGNVETSRYENVRFPRDVTKHPRLSVFVEPHGDSTHVAFVASQQKRHGALKRKYNDMEMIYDSVHPNPQMAMQCIDEELNMKNFDYIKTTRRRMKINCNVDTVKSFIQENLY
jgi:prophage antirepressor-like protein